MTITFDQLHALNGYLQRIDFSGVILDPNDHDESIHGLTPFMPPEPYVRVYSFKPATNPNVLNGGHLFTYGITAESVDTIVTSTDHWNSEAVRNGMMALKPGGKFYLCVAGISMPAHRAFLAQAGVSYVDTIDHPNQILIGRKPGGA